MNQSVNKNWLKFDTADDLANSFSVATSSNATEKVPRPIQEYIEEIQDIYLSDKRPWVIGFSGGKDSTAVLQLIYLAIKYLPKEKRIKPLFVVSSDTLVETPIVVNLIQETLNKVQSSSDEHELPITCHQVFPKNTDTFWVNLLGKGYPAPTKQFRWCTERMKIDPVSNFIRDTISHYEEVVVVLGSRTQESSSRAQVINKHKKKGTRLATHTTLPHAYIYTPIEDWSVNDVWDFLNGIKDFNNPWGGSNYPLWDLYQGTSAGECPLVIDTSTPSCGNSRFGCWVCTVVSKDRAMEGLIDSGETWMQPLLDFRNFLAKTSEPGNKEKYRNHKRRTGKVSYIKKEGVTSEKHIPGPYLLKYRKEWLKELLQIEKNLNADGHEISLITKDELHNIRTEWKNDPNEHDWEDSLPMIYREVYGHDLDWVENDAGAFSKPDAELLEKLGRKYTVSDDMVVKLIEIELSMDGLSKRRNIFDKIERVLTQDWGTLEEINKKNQLLGSSDYYDNLIDQLNYEYNSLKT